MKNTSPTKIMVFGTFDLLHKGHTHFFKQARKLATKPYLIVSVARDVNVKRIKGLKPVNNEVVRMRLMSQIPLVDKVVLGASTDYLSHITKEKPNIIALGYDQKAYTDNLVTNLKKRGLNVQVIRLKPFKHKVYKSTLLKKKMVK
jgi:FAD synthetase